MVSSRVWLLASFTAAIAACGTTDGDVLTFRDAGPPESIDGSPDASIADANVPDACAVADLSSSSLHCGYCGHDCGGGACLNGTCQPALVAVGEKPTAAALFGDRVYWLDYGPAGDMRSAGKDGSDLRVDVSPLDSAEGLFVDARGSVITEVGTGRVLRGGLDGKQTLLYDSQTSGAFDVVADSESVYWDDIYKGGVYKLARFSGGVPVAISTASVYPYGIAQDSTYVYWSARGNAVVTVPDASAPEPGAIMRARKDLSTTAEKLADAYDGRYLAVDGDGIYFGSGYTSRVYRLALTGGALQEIASLDDPLGIASDKDYIYASSGLYEDGAIIRVPKKGGAAEILASHLTRPSRLAIDDRFIYWANSKGGTVMRLAKP